MLKQDLTIFSGLMHGATLIGVVVTLLVNLVSQVPPMAHWPLQAALGLAVALVLVGANSVLTLFNYSH